MDQNNRLMTQDLLRAIVDDFPRRKMKTEKFMTDMGADTDFLHYSAMPPVSIIEIPTFSLTITKPLSLMLLERYLFSSDIKCGVDVWPCLTKISKIIRSKTTQSLHKSLKKHWNKSVPTQYSDCDLSIFGYTEDVPENIIYLAWGSHDEPKVIVYDSMNEARFDNIDKYLMYFLKSEQ